MTVDVDDVLDGIEDLHWTSQVAELLARTRGLAGRVGPSDRRWLLDEMEAFGLELAAGLRPNDRREWERKLHEIDR